MELYIIFTKKKKLQITFRHNLSMGLALTQKYGIGILYRIHLSHIYFPYTTSLHTLYVYDIIFHVKGIFCMMNN